MGNILAIFAALLALGLPVPNGGYLSYCNTNPPLCPTGVNHADCNPYVFSSSCPANCRLIGFYPNTPARQAFILLVNTLRNNTAGRVTLGEYNIPLPFASRMVYMGWDNNLAHLANKTLMQCFPNGDECRNTDVYPTAGQLLYSQVLSGSNDITNTKTVMEKAFEHWILTSSSVCINDIMAYRGIGPDFSQLIVDRNLKMGCAMRACPYSVTDTKYTYLCNFAVAPKIGCPIYTIGSKVCSGKGAVAQFPYLCNVDENYVSSCPNPLSCDSDANANCPNGTTHTTCLNYNDTRCLLRDFNETSALQTLNTIRRNNASLNVTDMQWDTNMTTLAAGFAVSCPISIADCSKTPAYSSFDQEIYCSPDGNTTDSQLLEDGFSYWSNCPKFNQSFVFTAQNATTQVGCAIWIPLNATKCVLCNFGIPN